jgi:hypothetical protein
MNSPAHAQMMLSAIGNLGQIVASRANAQAQRDQLQYELALAELRAGSLAHVVDAVITRRVDAVREGFLQVLRDFAVEAQHYRAQQDRYADAELETNDPLRRIELRKRLNDIDVELRQIRVDVRQLYDRMSEVILLIGGSTLRLDDGLSQQLMLSAPNG